MSVLTSPIRIPMKVTVDFEQFKMGLIAGGPTYTGDYEAVPSEDQQVFQTNGLVMRGDFVVGGIPRQDVNNEYGGVTVIIGGGSV